MHGGNIYEVSRETSIPVKKILDFSSNMNDFINIKSYFVKSSDIKNYPESKLDPYNKIISNDEFDGENIMIVPGLTYIIHKFILSLSGNIIIVSPSFTEYLNAPFNGNRIILPYNIIASNPEILFYYNYSAIFIVYPDNPTGNMLPLKSLNNILRISDEKNAYIFLDESFIYFVNKRELNENDIIKKHNNIIIGRSLTKFFSIPGLRIGYIASGKENIIHLNKIAEPWRMPQFSLEYIKDLDYASMLNIPETISRERKYMIGELEKLNFKLVGRPKANFITFKIPFDGRIIKSFLEKNGIMIRTLEDYDTFGKNFIRISIKQHNKNLI